MRVLAVSPSVPWPPDSGGRIRTAALLEQASVRVDLELWCVAQPDLDPGAVGELERRVGRVRLFPRSRPGPLRRAARTRPEQWFYSSELERALRDVARGAPGPAGGFDLVHFDEPCLVRALPAPSGPGSTGPGVVVQHHKLDRELHAALGAQRGLERLTHGLEARRLSRLEDLAARRWRHHLVCSPEDAARLARRHPRLELHVVPNGFDPRRIHPDPAAPGAARDPERLVFVGTLSYGPNVEGLVSFVRGVWPLVRRRHPRARLDLVGREPVPRLRALAGNGIRVVGPVEDVRPWLTSAAALVAPLSIGGGTRLKIIEALATGTPVIATATAAEGLELRDREHLDLVGDHCPRDFAARVDALMAEPAEAARRAERGRRSVWRRLRWEAVAPALLEAWARAARPGEAAGDPRRAPAPARERAACATNP